MMHNRISVPKLPSHHSPKKLSDLQQIKKEVVGRTAPFRISKGPNGKVLSMKRMERGRKFQPTATSTIVAKVIFFVLVSIVCLYVFLLRNIYFRPPFRMPIWDYGMPPMKLSKSIVSPFDSHPPNVTTLNTTGNVRHACLKEIRNHRHSFYLPYIKNANHVLLVDPAYHSNVGDHMITIAELTLLKSQSVDETTLSQCSYVQAHDFVPSCEDILQNELNVPSQMAKSTHSNQSSSTDSRQLYPHKVALWHGGGNFGNLWATAQQARIRSIVLLLRANFTIIGMPNSWFYTNTEIESNDIQHLRHNIVVGLGIDARTKDDITDALLSTLVKSRIIWTWREHSSYDRAIKLLPYCTHQLVPDIAFQLGPYLPMRPTFIPEGTSRTQEHRSSSTGTALNELDTIDIVFLLRNDHESLFASFRNRFSIQSILDNIPGASHLSFSIVDWDDRLSRFQPNNPPDIYFTETAIQLLSMGIVLICDRLHAAILAYIADLPFIYLDQISGKIHNTFTVAMESGPNCERSIVSSYDSNLTTIQNAQELWSHAETLPSAVEMALQIIHQRKPVNAFSSHSRHYRSIAREQKRNQIRQKLIMHKT